MRVVLYARVSSEKQVEKDLSIAAQLKALRNYSQKQGWEVYKEFVDEAQSARSANRPAFKEMIALAKKRHKLFDAILVWKLSRFARNREDSIIYKSLLRKYNISVLSMNEQVDDTPAGRLLEGMIEVIDEFYSINLAQDTLRGMKENAQRGYFNGGIIPMGYKAKKITDGSSKRTLLEPDEVFAPIIQRIFQMVLKGKGAKEIAKTLNNEGIRTNRGKLWDKKSIYFILKNETYAGTLVWNRKNWRQHKKKPSDEVVRVENNHPGLISPENFQYVQDLLRIRSPKITPPQTVSSSYLLSGLLCCGNCGARMTGYSTKNNGKRYLYYFCGNHASRGKDICDAKMINKGQLEDFVITRIKDNLLTDENLTKLVELTNQEINQVQIERKKRLGVAEHQMRDLRRKLQKLYHALESGTLEAEDLAPRIRELRTQSKDLQREQEELVESLKENKDEFLDPATVKAYSKDLKILLGKGSITEQRMFLRSFIRGIDVNHLKVSIAFNVPIEGRNPDLRKGIIWGKSEVAPRVGLEPTTYRLTADRSAN